MRVGARRGIGGGATPGPGIGEEDLPGSDVVDVGGKLIRRSAIFGVEGRESGSRIAEGVTGRAISAGGCRGALGGRIGGFGFSVTGSGLIGPEGLIVEAVGSGKGSVGCGWSWWSCSKRTLSSRSEAGSSMGGTATRFRLRGGGCGGTDTWDLAGGRGGTNRLGGESSGSGGGEGNFLASSSFFRSFSGSVVDIFSTTPTPSDEARSQSLPKRPRRGGTREGAAEFSCCFSDSDWLEVSAADVLRLATRPTSSHTFSIMPVLTNAHRLQVVLSLFKHHPEVQSGYIGRDLPGCGVLYDSAASLNM